MNAIIIARVTLALSTGMIAFLCPLLALGEQDSKSTGSSSYLNNSSNKGTKMEALKAFPEGNDVEFQKEVMRDRDPFSPIINGNQTRKKNQIHNIKLLGIVKVKDESAAFLKSPEGINTYYIGDEIGNNYRIIEISVNPALMKISNGEQDKIINFNNQLY